MFTESTTASWIGTQGTLQLLVDSISGAACDTSMFIFSALYQLLRSLLVPRLVLVTENLALRQQLLVLRRSTKRPGLRYRDRFFWVSLSHLWRDWRSILVIVKPETVIKWHRQGFKCYWRWKSRAGRVGRPRIDQEIRVLISRMSRENPTWGVPRIQAELHLLGCAALPRSDSRGTFF